ncbi:hypothetical protein BOX15_Mlig013342g1 [Macrostomum lignano]|uniref:Uncharacterized protein n=1 Tax=Macrostomum lignano TaxID=282301 RepID=A0A267DXI9_9PLAT|nr:hypothetical protein BOX15_Mlig013342g1 [Macrostomum lignano]
MMKQVSRHSPSSKPDTRNEEAVHVEERVIYFSFFVPHSLKQLFSNPKSDRRILKIETDCHCLFRLSPMKLSPSSPASRRMLLVEAFLDQQLGNFDRCESKLRVLLSRAGSGFELYRSINLNTLPNGGCDYRCYCATPAPLVEQSDNSLSGISTASSSVSQLQLSGTEGVARRSRESLAAFVYLEATAALLEEIAASSCGSTVEAAFFAALEEELSSQIWHCCIDRTASELTQSTARQLIDKACLVSQAASRQVGLLLDLAVFAKQICSELLNDNATVVWSGSEVQSNFSAVSSICKVSLSEDVSTEAGVTSAAESSMLSVSELLFDEVSKSSRQTPKPAPRIRTSKKQKIKVLGSLLDPLLENCCAFAAVEVCLESLVELVSQRLVLLMHRSSRTENQFECRVLKSLARFNFALREATSEPDLTGIVNRFFNCVADCLASPDAISAGQVTGLVAALQTPPMHTHLSIAKDSEGWQLLRKMREAFERAVCEQMESLLRCGRSRSSKNGQEQKDLNEAFIAACCDTSAELDSLPSEAVELEAHQQSQETPVMLLRRSQQNVELLHSDEVSERLSVKSEHGEAGLILSQPVDRAWSAVACSPATVYDSVAVWQAATPVRCEAGAADGLPGEDSLSATVLSIGHASLTSVGFATVSTTSAVTSESGPGLLTCCTLSIGSFAGAPVIQNNKAALSSITECSPISLDSVELLSRSVCLHRPLLPLRVRQPLWVGRPIRAAVSPQFCRPDCYAAKLLKSPAASQRSARALVATCTVQAQIRPLRNRCHPYSQRAILGLPESAPSLNSDRYRLSTVRIELAPVAATYRAKVADFVSIAAEPSGAFDSSMRAISSAASQRLCGSAEPAESNWRLCAPEGALAVVSAVRQAPAWHGGGELPECGWTRPSARLRPALAASTAAPLARASTAVCLSESLSTASDFFCQASAAASTIGDTTSSSAAEDLLANADCGLAVCWSGPSWATVTRMPSSSRRAGALPRASMRRPSRRRRRRRRLLRRTCRASDIHDNGDSLRRADCGLQRWN